MVCFALIDCTSEVSQFGLFSSAFIHCPSQAFNWLTFVLLRLIKKNSSEVAAMKIFHKLLSAGIWTPVLKNNSRSILIMASNELQQGSIKFNSFIVSMQNIR